MNQANVVTIQNLTKHYGGGAGGLFDAQPLVRAVENVSFSIACGQTLAIVGESGCGKSTLARMIALLSSPTSGTIELDGETTSNKSQRQLRPMRRNVQMVFQDPYAALNPRMTAARIIAEPLVVQQVGTDKTRRTETHDLACAVGLAPDELDRYPHQFSGGQRQRIAIARALALTPKLIVADEPTSALDVSVQSQVLNLFGELKVNHNLAYLLISHDLSVVRHMADKVGVMYLGRIVEMADRDTLFRAPRHPYTRALIDAAPVIGPKRRKRRGHAFDEVPNPSAIPSGCPYHPRCAWADDICKQRRPKLSPSDNHQFACHHPLPIQSGQNR